MRQAASIVCIGGANVDRKARLLAPFQLGTSHPVTTTQTAGGVARNVAENLGRLAQPVSLVSTVGDDRDGQWLIDVTSRYVNTHISHPPNENREDFLCPSSNESLTYKESEGVFLS